jgi:DNA adenine methylase
MLGRINYERLRRLGSDQTPQTPFLKWAGGKRWLVQGHPTIFPTTYNRYFEPFLGGGSVFFHLRPRRATLGDINPELIATYECIRKDWRGIHASLTYRQRVHTSDDSYYYRVRARNPSDPTERASRFIYLNRTCFNGIYRVNRNGDFNVPRGNRDSVRLETDDFHGLAESLKDAELRVSDFESLINESTVGDLVFADPPYTILHNYNGFMRYNEVLFSWEDQQRLAMCLSFAKDRGVKIIATNANHKSVRALYAEQGFSTCVLSRTSRISADIKKRREFEELIISANV